MSPRAWPGVLGKDLAMNVHAAELAQTGQSPDQLRARAGYYRLLAGAFIEEPGRDYLIALRSKEVQAELHDLGVRFDPDVTDTDVDTLVSELACEYAALFTSPGGCPPIESARLSGRLQQTAFEQVRAAYAQAGFKVRQGRFTLFEDQLGVELSFVAALLDRLAAARKADDLDSAKHLEKEIKRFWALHLGLWVRGYARLLERVTVHSFYREIAALLGTFAEAELELIGVHVDDVDGGREVVPKADIPLEFNPDEPVCGGCRGPDSDSAVA
ncbi:molecular chaperone [Bradyrhizobium sp.]|uniref:TorD/DmsD family molecular chaperone n=1 Tax=Bradyrhizobium sp. TaxID=376 RepID=UPI0025C63709|nr:molecular chaperone TorD family protein [Bradyrhizobium sp.]